MSEDDALVDEYVRLRPESVAMRDRAAKTMAGLVGHDLRWFEPVPMYTVRGRGARKWDVDGNEYVDCKMGNGALMLGHASGPVVDAIRSATERGTHFGDDHLSQLAWAELLRELLPSAERVRFVNSGTEATLLAYRLAQAHTGRSKIMKLEGHFHGWHDHALLGTAPPFDVMPSVGVPKRVDEETIVAPHDINVLESMLIGDGDIAALFLEPSGASWGRVPIDPALVVGLRKLSERFGVVLIFDEVVTGFRWGTGGAQEVLGVTPDVTCLAKISAGGMPGGALVGKAEFMKHFEFGGAKVLHYGTFNASPLTAAAAIATIEAIRDSDAVAHADAAAAELRDGMNDIFERRGAAGYAYGPASTFHVYFETDQAVLDGATSRSELTTTDPQRLKGMPGLLVSRYQQHLRLRGVDYMSSTGGVTSAAHTGADIAHVLGAFDETIEALISERLLAVLG